MDSKEGELSKFSPGTIMKIGFWLTLIGAVVMLIALTNNSWAYQEDNGNTVTEVGLWKRCRHTLTSHSCSNIDFPYNNCSILLSSRNGLQDGIMPQCTRFRSTGGLAVVGCGLAVLAAVFIRSSTGNPGEKKLRNLCVTFGAAFVGLVAMSLWAQYFTDNFKLRTGGTGNFESGLGSGWMLMTAGWILCAIAGLLILLFVPESDNKVAKHKVGLALVIGIISLLFCVVAFATPAWSQSEGDGGAGGPVSSAGVGLFQLCLVSRADGSTVCYNQNVRQCEWTESNSGINLQYRLTGCRAFQTVRGLQAIALICSVATVVLLVLIYRGANKWKAPALFLALIAALTGMVAMALYKGWSDENFPIAGSFGTQNFSIGYSFAFCIVGWVLMVLAAYFLYDGVADSNESLVDPPTAHKMGLYAGIMCALALLLVVIGLGLPYWAESVQEPSFKAHMGLYQYCWSQQGVQNDEVCSPIDTGCATSSSSPAPTTVQLKECPRIQTVRAFTILSFLFGIVAAVLAILGYTKDEISKKTWAFIMCIVCAVQGFIAMAAWLGYFERNIEPGMGASLAFPNPGLSHSFGLHVAGVMLYCLAAVAAFVSMSGAPEAARPQSEAKQPGEGEKV